MDNNPKLTSRLMMLITMGLTVSMVVILVACAGNGEELGVRSPEDVPNGDPEHGADLMIAYGCGSCHAIPGIPGADGSVGPPLTDYARRDYVAGNLLNEPETLIAWIMNPQAIEPGTGMPNMDVSEPEARDMAAYLYSLK